jgi:hypothetical protein
MRSAFVIRGTTILVRRARRERVFIHMIAVDVVQMAIMEIIDVAVVPDGGMAAIRTMDVCVLLLFHASFSHCFPFFSRSMSGRTTGIGSWGAYWSTGDKPRIFSSAFIIGSYVHSVKDRL